MNGRRLSPESPMSRMVRSVGAVGKWLNKAGVSHNPLLKFGLSSLNSS